MNKEKFDVIERPQHYACEEVKITIEPIQLCEQCGFLVGNGLKYLIRYKHKGNPLQDLRKAEYYFSRWLTVEGDYVDMTVFPVNYNYIFNAFKHLPYLKNAAINSNVGIVQCLLDWTRKKISELEMKSVEMGK